MCSSMGLSSLLFFVYTNHISCGGEKIKLLKYADGMALVAHLTDSHTPLQYQEEVKRLTQTFVESLLELNISKTKELCCGPTGKTSPLLTQPLTIQNQVVEQASKDILTLVYRSLIESLLTFDISSWYNFLTIKHRIKPSRIINEATYPSLTKHQQKNLESCCYKSLIQCCKNPSLQPLRGHKKKTSFQAFMIPSTASLSKRKQLFKYLQPTPPETLPIVPSPLGTSSGFEDSEDNKKNLDNDSSISPAFLQIIPDKANEEG
ncbi:hypothetical protein DNTS_025588 [Danionella cerebrum]|uniref:Reverse transcriptase domain-containing protein n=1 Tax=Danionella cerebrum TaxID=2873325 RepID=A0A553PYR4_9TELE|nr:hypothetical protein DNTS_025588 [Danionella translucida]